VPSLLEHSPGWPGQPRPGRDSDKRWHRSGELHQNRSIVHRLRRHAMEKRSTLGLLSNVSSRQVFTRISSLGAPVHPALARRQWHPFLIRLDKHPTGGPAVWPGRDSDKRWHRSGEPQQDRSIVYRLRCHSMEKWFVTQVFTRIRESPRGSLQASVHWALARRQWHRA